MSEKSLKIVRAHDGETGYRWYLGVGMDLIEGLAEAIDVGEKDDVKDLGSALVDVLLDCVPALGISLIHICSRARLIQMCSLVDKDDPRADKLIRKYRDIVAGVAKVGQRGGAG